MYQINLSIVSCRCCSKLNDNYAGDWSQLESKDNLNLQLRQIFCLLSCLVYIINYQMLVRETDSHSESHQYFLLNIISM